MAQQPIELILMRELADLLATPIFVVDGEGGLVFYNELAEELLGRRFEETGPMPAEEWSTVFEPVDVDGNPMAPADLPLVVALREGHAAHETFDIRGLDGTTRQLETTLRAWRVSPGRKYVRERQIVRSDESPGLPWTSVGPASALPRHRKKKGAR
jgi:PAS domain-containing protein